MAQQDIVVRVRAEIGAFKRDMDAAAQAAKKTADATNKAGAQSESGIGKLTTVAENHSQAWNTVSTGLLAGGAAIVGGLGLATKAAISWESAWAGVMKTVDDSPEGYAELESELRGLAKTLPATHTEIAGVAEAAGQLGVAREDITGFTKTMIDLGESTNLTAEDAATNIAQISNVMGTMGREGAEGVERFGATLVELGNNGASTEAEIVSMAQRISGAAATVGASEVDVLALSNTLASMGVNAELGGGVVTRVLLKMRTAVDEGGESLTSFANVAGLSADDFATKFREAPVEALDLLSKGIGSANEAGENITATLGELGIKGTQETQVMLALANSGDLLSDSLDQGADAWRENSALAEEAGKRYETAESRIAIAWNNIKDAAIDVGGVIAPVIAKLADGVSTLASWFGDLSAPAQIALTVLGGFVGVSALAAGAFMKLAPSIIETVNGIKAINRVAPGAASMVGKIGGAASIAAVAIAGLSILGSVITNKHVEDSKNLADGIKRVAESSKNGAGAQEMKSWSGIFDSFDKGVGSLNDTTTAIDELNDAFSTWTTVAGADRTGGVRGIVDAVEVIGNPTFMDGVNKNLNFMNEWFNLPDDRITEIENRFKDLGVELAGFASAGDMETVSATFQEMQGSFADAGISSYDMLNYFPSLRDELRGIAEEAGVTVTQTDLVTWAMTGVQPAAVSAAQGLQETEAALGGTAISAEAAAEAVDAFYDSLVAAGLVTLNERESMRALEESFASASKTILENGETLDISTEKGRQNEAALDGIASATWGAIEASRENGATTAELVGIMASSRESFIENAVAAGMEEKAAAALADQLGLIPESVITTFDSNSQDIGNRIIELHEIIQSTPDKTITIDDNSPEVKQALKDLGYVITELPDGRIEVTDDGTAEATGKKADAVAAKYREAQITATASTSSAESELNHTARPRNSVVTQTVSIQRQITESIQKIDNGPITSRFGRANGGSVFGPGTETSDSIPAWLSTNEHVLSAKEVRGLGGHSAVESLRAMARAGNAPAFATGGAVGRAENKVKSTKRTYDRIDSSKANRLRKLAAKDQWEAAKDELKSAKAQSKASSDTAKKNADARKKAAEEERARVSRLGETSRDLKQDLRRGTITDAFTSGSGLGQVDKLIDVSRNQDYSKSKRTAAMRDAAGLEKALASLTKQSEGLEKALEAAKSKADELRAVRDAVANDLRGEFSLSGMLSETRQDLGANPFNAKSISSKANKTARRIEIFAGRLNRLRKLGYGETIIQEIAALGTEDGILAAGALMDASKSERSNIIKAYDRLDTASGKAGQYVTESMYKGGLDAADGLVRGLESKTKNVEDAFYRLGKNAEKSFKRSLGIKSPSRVMFGAGVNVGEGAELGILSKVGAVESAAEKLMTPQAFTIPPSPEVSRYQPAQNTMLRVDSEMIANAVSGALTSYQPVVNIDGRKFHGTMQEVNRQYGNRR